MSDSLRKFTDVHQLEDACRADLGALVRDLLSAADQLGPDVELELASGVTVTAQSLEAIGRALAGEQSFLERHPEALFQCLYNRLYWHDASEAAAHYPPGTEGAWKKGPALASLAEHWRAQKEADPAFCWVRSRRPLPGGLGPPRGELVLHGALEEVQSLASSPDGKLLAAGCWSAVVIWELETGRVVSRLPTDECEILGLAFSPDSRRLATGSRDHTARVWNLEDETLAWEAGGHEGRVTSVAFSPDGAKVLVGNLGWTARIYDAAGAELLTLNGHRQSILAVAFAPDGRRVATSGSDSSVRVWDAQSGECLQILGDCPQEEEDAGESHMGTPIETLAFSPSGARLAAGVRGEIKVWDTTSWELACSLGEADRASPNALAWTGEERLVASSYCLVELWDVSSETRLLQEREAQSSSNHMPQATFLERGARVAKSRSAGLVRVWSPRDGAAAAPLKQTGSGQGIEGLEVDPRTGHVILRVGHRPLLFALDVSSGVLKALAQPEGPLPNLAMSPGSQRLAHGCEEYGEPPAYAVFELGRGEQTCTFGAVPPEDRTFCERTLTFHPDGRRLLGVLHRQVLVWDAVSGDPLGALGWSEDGDRPIASLRVVNEGRLLIAALRNDFRGGGSEFKIWSLDDGVVRAEGKLIDELAVTVSACGELAAAARADGKIYVWNLREGGMRFLSAERAATALAFSPDGSILAAGGSTLQLWDVKTLTLLSEESGHPNSIRRLAWTEAGLISGCPSETRVWGSQAKTCLATLGPLEAAGPVDWSERFHGLWVSGEQEAEIRQACDPAPLAFLSDPLSEAQALGETLIVARGATASDVVFLLEVRGTGRVEQPFRPFEEAAPAPRIKGAGRSAPAASPPRDVPPKPSGFTRF